MREIKLRNRRVRKPDGTWTDASEIGRDGIDGVDGVDGFSPTVSVEETTSGATITVTDKDGTKETEIEIPKKVIDDLSTAENRTWSASHIAQRFGEVEMAKFPNVTIIGQPRIQNGQISNFSATDYCQFPFVVNFQGQPFQIDLEITTGNDVSMQHNVLDSVFGLAFAVRQSRFVIALSTTGTSWNIGEGVGTHVVTANTTYKVRMTWNGSQFILSYSTDGGTTYITDITKVLTEQPYPKQMFIGVSSDKHANFNGIINLNYASLTIANKIVWTGMDDVGLATRADVSLSNIDELGVAKIALLISTYADSEIAEAMSALKPIEYDEKTVIPDYDAETEITEFLDGYAINTNGTIVPVSGYSVTDFIDLNGVSTIFRYGTATRFSLRRYALYDANKNLLKYYASTTTYDLITIGSHDNATPFEMTVDGIKARYIRIEKETSRTVYHFSFYGEKNVYLSERNEIIAPNITKMTVVTDKSAKLQLKDKIIVNLGDSIFGNVDDSSGVSKQIEANLNATVINCSFGGTKACNRNDNMSNWRAFDFAAISQSIVSGDWSMQEAALANSDTLPSGSSNKLIAYYRDRLTRLRNIDFSKVDIVTFNYGTNDYTDSADERVLYKTRLEECVKRIQTAFPHIMFVAISPTWRIFISETDQPDSDTYYKSWSGGSNVVLPLWCDAMKEVCDTKLHIPFVDCYNIGINRANYTRFFPSNDGTHHNEYGRARLGEHIARGLLSLI